MFLSPKAPGALCLWRTDKRCNTEGSLGVIKMTAEFSGRDDKEPGPGKQPVREEGVGFELLHQLYRDRILNYCYRFTGNFHVAEELTQETFLRLYQHLGQLTGPVSAWLYRVASNLAKNALRDRKRRVGDAADPEAVEKVSDPSLGPELLAQRRELEARVSGVLASLPPQYREVLLLCDLQDLSYDEAARVLCISRSNVGVLLYRARRLAARKLGEEKSRCI